MTAVEQVALPDGRSVWMVFGHALARQVLGDTRLSNDTGAMGDKAPLAGLPATVRDIVAQDMLNNDPPQHTRLRKLVAHRFTGRSTSAMRPVVKEIAERLLDDMDAPGEIDLVVEYARPLPTLVLGSMIGIPDADCPDVQRWSDVFVSEVLLASDSLLDATKSLLDYISELARRKRREPGEDLISELVTAKLSDDELSATVFVLLIAGQTATTQLIAQALYLLLTNPEQLDAVRADMMLLGGAVDEALRLNPPLRMTAFRMARESLLLGATEVPAGEIVLCSLPSANTDPAKFVDRHRFDVRRASNQHLSFGFGIHRCLGASLARMEAETAIGALLRRHPELRITTPVEELPWVEMAIARKLMSLPVHLSS
ncbi:cytochrome P450 [Lentzea sp. NPDC004782]|uniref:cytochrome P450 family protein n=1 Tax=Lentzea sp. NPDC004782 TaxID=3154458 RepID=UPI0033B87810